MTKLSSAIEEIIVLVDGNKKIPGLKHFQREIIQGDGYSASIAAASVIAKVHRDQFMSELSQAHPQYFWHKNKGYGSQSHRKALAEHGISSWHRQVFIRNVDLPELAMAVLD